MSDGPAVQEVAQSPQRRQLTLVFCDLVGSTALSARLDPEDVAELYRSFRDLCASTIEAAGGYVAKYMGDGALAYFGFPTAHEDAAERAVYAALNLVEAAPKIPTGLEAPLGVRVGIATGLTIVGDLVGDRAAEIGDVIGETPNLAARLQGAAGANEILVSNATQRLASGLFTFEDVGPLPLKGLELKEPVWRVTGARVAPERYLARRRSDRAPMIGRERELELLLQHWRACQEGRLQIVGVEGEAGIGKSRLADEFRQIVKQEGGAVWLESHGVQIFSNTPFYAVAQTIRRRLTGSGEVGPRRLMRRLMALLKAVGADEGHAGAVIADLIEAENAESPVLMGEARRRLLIESVARWLIRSAEHAPTVLLVDDLQWIDPSSLELLRTVAEQTYRAPLFVLYTARPGARVPWTEGTSTISLERLDHEASRRLIAAVAPRPLALNVLDMVVARSGGVPFFAEELTRLVGDDAGGEISIPSALSDLLQARLDQLGPAKQVAQIAAVVGGDIPVPVLLQIAGVEESELSHALEVLTDLNIMVQSEGQAYAFRHALLESAAYETLLRRLRRTLHGRVARTILELLPEAVERRPEVIAQHWAKAEEHHEALLAWKLAARSAFGRQAFRETAEACEQGLIALGKLEPSIEYEREELTLLNLLFEASRGVDGYGSPRAEAATARAKELANRHGGVVHQLRTAMGEWSVASARGDYAAAAKPAERYAELARADGRPAALGLAHMMMMMSRYRIGELIAAEEAYRAGEPYFEDPGFLRAQGAVAETFGNAALLAWLLGDAGEAASRSERGMKLSRASGSPYDLAYAHYWAAIQALVLEAPADAEGHARIVIEISESHGYRALARTVRIMLGAALARMGHLSEGVDMLRSHITRKGATDNSMTMYFTWLARAEEAAGDATAALATLDKALSVNPIELFFRPETLRLRGDVQLALGQARLARVDYDAALRLAQAMKAKVFVERTKASLQRLIDGAGVQPIGESPTQHLAASRGCG
jgi:class 3 adenylate cyclase/tetratricopeptide (TPR) repeat protein